MTNRRNADRASGAALRFGEGFDGKRAIRHSGRVVDGVSESLRTAAEDLSGRYFDRLWESRGAECEVWPARRIDRRRRVVVEGIELIGFDTGDEKEWPGYFEPVRERNWFSRDWRRVQSVDAAVGAIEEHLRRWVGGDH